MSIPKQPYQKKINKSQDNKLTKTNQPKKLASNDFREKFNKMELQPLKTFDIPILSNITQKFRKDVQVPIELQTSIFNSKSLQRCLQHNNVSTLYCISDKKPLCVTCMYQNTSHKKHKVVPLNRASRELENQQKKDLTILDQNLSIIDGLISKSHSNLTKSQKEFPTIISTINDFYKQLEELLSQKKIQQISHIQNTWQKMRYEYSSLSSQLQRIKIYILQQIKQIKKRQGQQFLLFNRNICNNLIQIQNIVNPNICQYHQVSYYEDIKKFREFQIQIGNTLALTSPFKEKVKRESHEKSKKYLKSGNQANANVLTENRHQLQRKNTNKSNSITNPQIKGIENKKRSISPQPKKSHSPIRSPQLQTPIKS